MPDAPYDKSKPLTLLFRNARTTFVIPARVDAAVSGLRGELFAAVSGLGEQARRLSCGGVPEGKGAGDLRLGVWEGDVETGEWREVVEGETVEECGLREGGVVCWSWGGEFVVEVPEL